MMQELNDRLEELGLLPYLEYCNTTLMKVGNVEVPMISYDNKAKSKTKIIVSAGADGDELDGVVAAFRLIKHFSSSRCLVRLIILPILDPFAFVNFTSYSPVDNKFFKYYYPGNIKGSFTQRFTNRVFGKYFKAANIWIDLHGGNKHEDIISFVLGHVTDNEKINKMTKRILYKLNDECVLQKNHQWEKVSNLVKENITYLISEAGGKGVLDKTMQNVHMARVKKIISHMLERDKRIYDFPESIIEMFHVKKGRMWVPKIGVGDVLSIGDELGRAKGRFLSKKIKVKAELKVLWVREKSRLRVDEAVCGAQRV